MPGRLELEFVRFGAPTKGVLVLFCEEGVKFGSVARRAIEPVEGLIKRAATADRFKGKNGSALDLVAPSGLDVQRRERNTRSALSSWASARRAILSRRIS